MKFYAKLQGIIGNKISAVLDDDVNISRLQKLSGNKQPTIEVEFSDGRSISVDQRKKIYALIGEISNWSGYMIADEAPQVMKWQYLMQTGKDMFSLSDCTMTQANNYLSWLLDFCFNNDIPFKTRTWDMLPNDFAMQYRCLTHRKCCICGKSADVAHFETVGMGRNRHHIDHGNYHFMALCREHHMEQHRIGIKEFLQKYHIKPIKLDSDDRKKLRIGG
ncbi:putative HNHc nuclease [Companilactobacillus keshanensis]|uniref:HNHc nuclease n=1 Tax=Companilactobacillus keshanensis TaxID=2486003 RepID=A0ABW4BVD1_9LACO|nr:putative HNHc nuclease [Companilactobacillus keshanensis]